jgi:hypothetical protein
VDLRDDVVIFQRTQGAAQRVRRNAGAFQLGGPLQAAVLQVYVWRFEIVDQLFGKIGVGDDGKIDAAGGWTEIAVASKPQRYSPLKRSLNTDRAPSSSD